MTDNVKGFIENNIDKIDAQDWDSVIESFYETYTSVFFCGDEDFEELTKVFNAAGIDFIALTEHARREFMLNIIDQILDDKIQSARFRNSDEIKKSDILMHIDCDLGLSSEALDTMMEEVGVNKYGLEPDFTCFYVK